MKKTRLILFSLAGAFLIAGAAYSIITNKVSLSLLSASEARVGKNKAAWTLPTTIMGYAGKVSVNKGESVDLYVSTSKTTFTIEVYRMGWNSGRKAFHASDKVLTDTATGIAQTISIPTSAPYLVEQSWTSNYTLNTSSSWSSGVYLIKLIEPTAYSFIPLVIRDDSSTSDILYQIPVANYQAYNNWGDFSLYGNEDEIQADKVSFDRPYSDGNGAGQFFYGDYYMIRWLEAKGYDVSYTTSLDLHDSADIMDNHKVFLTNFHDEYWSKGMRDHLEEILDDGKDFAVLGGNNIFWQVRFEPSSSSVPKRVMVGYKEDARGPGNPDPMFSIDPTQTTGLWRNADFADAPENEILGTLSGHGLIFDSNESFPWVVSDASHWIYNGTGLANGDSIAGLIGYEAEIEVNNGHTPSGLNIVAESPISPIVCSPKSDPVEESDLPCMTSSVAHSSIHTKASGSIVFSAGTFYFPWLLEEFQSADVGVRTSAYKFRFTDNVPKYTYHKDFRAERIVENVLHKMITGNSPSTAMGPAAYYSIYDEGLGAGWADSSWDSAAEVPTTFPDPPAPCPGSAPNYTCMEKAMFTPPGKASTARVVNSYDNSIAWRATAGFAGLAFDRTTAINTTGYEYLSFEIKLTTNTQDVRIQLWDHNGNPLTPNPVAISNYGGTFVGSYHLYYIPLADLGASTAQVKTIHFRNWKTTAQDTVYVDKIGLRAFTPIYDEGLASGWTDVSWDSTVNYNDTASPLLGTKAIAWTATAGFAGLAITLPNSMPVSGYNYLVLSMKATAAGASVGVLAIDIDGQPAVTPLLLSNTFYGAGNPVTSGYRHYLLPLWTPPGTSGTGTMQVDLSRPSIKTIHIRNWSGGAQSKIYIDHIGLI